MCPEFSSHHMEKDQPGSEKRHRDYRPSSPTRTDDEYRAARNCDALHGVKRDSSNQRTAHLKEREPNCSFRNKDYRNADVDGKRRTERNRSPNTDYSHKEAHARENRRSRSRSPGHQKVISESDSYQYEKERSDPRARGQRRHTDNFGSGRHMSKERSPRRKRSPHSATTRHKQRSEQDHYADSGSRHFTNEPERRKYMEVSRLVDEKHHCSKYLCSDLPDSSDRKVHATKTSRRHSDGQKTEDCSPRGRYCNSDRRSDTELCQDICHSRNLSVGFYDCKANYSAVSNYVSSKIADQGIMRRNIINDHHSHHNAASGNKLHSTSYRNRTDDDWKSHATDRRRSSLYDDRYSSIKDERFSLRKLRTVSDSQKSTNRDHFHSSENVTNNALFYEQPSLKEERNRKFPETFLPDAGIEEPGAVTVKRKYEGRMSSHGNNCKEESRVFHPHMPYFPWTDQSGSDTDKKQYHPYSDSSCPWTRSSNGAVSSGSEYHVTTSLSAAQHWVDHCVTCSHLPRAVWPGSTIQTPTGPTVSSRLHDLVPTASVTRLPLLSTKTSTAPTSIDHRQLRISGVSLNSNVVLTNMPFNLASGGQFVIDEVSGDSPLLDEPTYSPVGPHDSSVHLVGSSGSSLELTHSKDNMDLKNLLDVVTNAKTSLEQTLPPSCQADLNNYKQQKLANMERIAEEVKCALKPFFVHNEIDKEEYKDIMRKAVPKIASSKAGIDTKRIREFVSSYVAKVKAAQKRAVAAKRHVVEQQSSTSAELEVDTLATAVNT